MITSESYIHVYLLHEYTNDFGGKDCQILTQFSNFCQKWSQPHPTPHLKKYVSPSSKYHAHTFLSKY